MDGLERILQRRGPGEEERQDSIHQWTGKHHITCKFICGHSLLFDFLLIHITCKAYIYAIKGPRIVLYLIDIR